MAANNSLAFKDPSIQYGVSYANDGIYAIQMNRLTGRLIKPTSALKAFGFSALAANPPPR